MTQTHSPPRRRFLDGLKTMPRSRQLLLAGLLLVILALVLRFTVFSGDKGPQMLTAPVTRGDVEQTVLATGVLEPARLVSVGAQVSGRVERLHVEVGRQVRRGELIAEIDPLIQQNSVRTAEASLAQITAQRAAQAATLQQAELAFRRQSQMMAEDATARADYESAEAALKSARGSLQALDAQIAQARVQLSTAQVNLGYTRITAPIDGTVVAVVTQEGQTVNANQSAPTIVKLAELDIMQVKAQISEADVVKVKPEQTVYFTILGEPDRKYYARLQTVEPAPESIETEDSASSTASSSSSTATATAIYYNGLFNVDNPDGRLRTSMTAQVYVVLARAKNALTIPSAALGQKGRDGRYTVQVLGKNGKPQPRQVAIGVNNGVQAQVLKGLSEGETVALASGSAGGSGQGGGDTERRTQRMMQRAGGPGMMMGGPPPGRGPGG